MEGERVGTVKRLSDVEANRCRNKEQTDSQRDAMEEQRDGQKEQSHRDGKIE